MQAVNMLEAKSSLSRLVEAVETGSQAEIVIARNGRPAARLVAVNTSMAGRRIGVARGAFTMPASIDDASDEMAALFDGSAD